MTVSLTQQRPALSIGRSAYMQTKFPHVGLSDLHNFNIFKAKKSDVETGYLFYWLAALASKLVGAFRKLALHT